MILLLCLLSFYSMSKDKPVSSHHLRDIPSEVMNTVYDRQNELKKIAGRHVSLEKTFCRIVREWREFKEKEGKKWI